MSANQSEELKNEIAKLSNEDLDKIAGGRGYGDCIQAGCDYVLNHCICQDVDDL